ncbi:hypothetical protein B7P43_G17483 [Cryptotermes secundus]|uniref:Uncharacterized protein n=1 Tax=Cryptotermes secundus TaxID=105785 RepID=A0A2J7Q1B4_9NEOP|nr:hypothetical protein B7P43_G17483 [Cryptotermes secundus]
MRGVKKKLPSTSTPGSALQERQCSLSPLQPRVQLPMYTCAQQTSVNKHLAAGTVKRTVPYKDLATDIKLKDYILYCTSIKKELKKKGLII